MTSFLASEISAHCMSVDIQDSFGHSKSGACHLSCCSRGDHRQLSVDKNSILFVNLPVFMCCPWLFLLGFFGICLSINRTVYLPSFFSFFFSFFFLSDFLSVFCLLSFCLSFFTFPCLSVCICLYVYQSGVFEIRFHCAGYLGKLGKAARHLN